MVAAIDLFQDSNGCLKTQKTVFRIPPQQISVGHIVVQVRPVRVFRPIAFVQDGERFPVPVEGCVQQFFRLLFAALVSGPAAEFIVEQTDIVADAGVSGKVLPE